MTVTLAQLEAVARAYFDTVERRGDAVMTDVTHDSRQVRPGSLFVARRGTRTDGHAYLEEALRRGAAAVAVEHGVAPEAPLLRVPWTTPLCGPWAALVHGNASEAMSVVGVTGTNGKTTLTYLLQAAGQASGLRTGLVGTIETQVGDHCSPSLLTTPQATDLQRTFAEMRRAGTDMVAMEVSSHGLDQHRVEGTRFDLAIFTNLEPEHLDYHGTVEHYYATKASLFTPEFAGRGLICVDDAWGVRLASQTALPARTYGAAGTGADVRYTVEDRGLDGLRVLLEGQAGRVTLESRLVGAINAPNVVGAYLAAVEVGIDADQAAAGIAACPRPPGRFQLVELGQPFLVVVDYAHTPHSLLSMLETSRRLAGSHGRVGVVVGARGGRDREKRQDSGRAAASADLAVLTSDSPGSEPPEAILEQLSLGTLGMPGSQVVCDVDRAQAIRRAVSWARPGDVVLIVGRGHERHLRWGDRVVAFDDRRVALNALRGLGYGAAHPDGATASLPRSAAGTGPRLETGSPQGADDTVEPTGTEVVGSRPPWRWRGDGPG